VLRHVESTTSTETAAESYNTEQSKGFVIVGDNFNKNFWPSHWQEERQTKSLHVFHSCAVKNWVDVLSPSDKPALTVLTDDLFLLSKDDVTELLNKFEVLVSRFAG